MIHSAFRDQNIMGTSWNMKKSNGLKLNLLKMLKCFVGGLGTCKPEPKGGKAIGGVLCENRTRDGQRLAYHSPKPNENKGEEETYGANNPWRRENPRPTHWPTETRETKMNCVEALVVLMLVEREGTTTQPVVGSSTTREREGVEITMWG